MSITPVNKTQSKLGSYLRGTVLSLVGIGSLAGVYLHMDGKIGETNTQLTKKLNDSETARKSLLGDLESEKAKIAKLQQDLLNNENTDKEDKTTLDRISSDIKSHGTQIIGLTEKDKKLDEGMSLVTGRVGKLENEVSLSELQDVYNQALASAAIIEIKMKHMEDDGKGGKVEGSHMHSGSGVIVAHIGNGEKGGYIATNWHVVKCDALEEKDVKDVEAKITLPNGKTVKAKPYLYKDKDGNEQLARKTEHDLILFKTTDNISSTRPVPFALDEPKIGEAILTIGNPFGPAIGNRFVASLGIISGDSQVKSEKDAINIVADGGEGTIKAIRTDAAINPGSSGGLGWRIKDGKLVIMPEFIYVQEGAASGIGFGIPAPRITSNIKTWLPSYNLNEKDVFVEKVEKKGSP